MLATCPFPLRDSRRSPRVLALWVASLLLPVAAASQTWTVEYDASLGTKPSAQGFTHVASDPLPDDGLDESNYTVGGGLLVQGETGGVSVDPANTQSYELTSADFDLDHDVIEVHFRLRVASATSAPGGSPPYSGFAVVVADRLFNEITAFIAEDGAFLSAPPFGTALALFDATDMLHDYVFRVGPKGAALERDGTEVATLERDDYDNLSAGTLNRVAIGDVSTLGRSSSELASFSVRRFSPPVAEVRNYQVVTETYSAVEGDVDSLSPKTVTAECPAGTMVLGGGASSDDGPDVGLSESYPDSGSPAGWVGSARELVDTSADWDLQVDAICGEVSGYRHVVEVGAQTTDAWQTGERFCDDPLAVPLTEYPYGGGVSLTGASLRQALSLSAGSFPVGFGPRWGGSLDDIGAGTSSGAWGVDVHALCTDATRHEVEADTILFGPGSLAQLPVNCRGGKLPVSGGASGSGGTLGTGDGRLEWHRPKAGAPSAPPVGWEAQARSTGGMLGMSVSANCLPLADPTVSAHGLFVRLRGEFDAEDSWGWAHGTLMNGVGFAPGIEGQAFSFDGDALDNDQWVSVPTQPTSGIETTDLYPEDDFTAAAWIRTTASPAGLMTVFQMYDLAGPSPLGSNVSLWSIVLDEDQHAQGRFRTPTSAVQFVDGGVPLNDGGWHHVALVRDQRAFELILYVDGVEVDSVALVGAPVDQPLVPGAPGFPDPVSIEAWREAGGTGIDREFEGEIDEFTYWDRTLTPDEIQNLVGCHKPLSPRVLNLDADRFTSPAGAGHTLCVWLEAGTHELTLVDPIADADARHTGWSSGPSDAWGTAFSVEPEVDSGFVFGLPVSETSGPAAFANTTDKDTTLTLSQAQRVHFSLVDATAFDNRGGVSIQLPEPGVGSGLVAGILLLRVLARRRG